MREQACRILERLQRSPRIEAPRALDPWRRRRRARSVEGSREERFGGDEDGEAKKKEKKNNGLHYYIISRIYKDFSTLSLFFYIYTPGKIYNLLKFCLYRYSHLLIDMLKKIKLNKI